MHLDELAAAARARLPGLLVATDFDGTLAPIVVDPEMSRPVPGAVEALTRLARQGARIVVITGRDSLTAVRLGGLRDVPDLVVEGLYGLQRWHDGVLDSPDEPGSIRELRERLPALLVDNHADEEIWIEDKGLSLVVHARRAADPDVALLPVRDAVHALAKELGLEAHDGKDVLEFRLPGYEKGAALRRAAEGATGILYAGDDVGDLPAFEAARALGGWTVVASSPEITLDVAPDLVVDGPTGVVDLFRRIGGLPAAS